MTKRKAATDIDLLQDFVSKRSQEAFCTLVQRHVDMVYGAALRRVRTPALAEDVTQAVFIVLAQKARHLTGVRTLGGWLLRVTRCASVDAIRKERVRTTYERRAARGRQEAGPSDNGMPLEHEQRSAAVDEALSRLTTLDREALLLRFYQDASFAEIGISLGVSEEAARKRSDRALVKLRKLLARRGGLVMSAILPAMWLRQAHAAPVALTEQIMRDLSGSAIPHSKMILVKGALKMMTMQAVKLTTAGIAACVIAAGAGYWIVTVSGAGSPKNSPVPEQSAAVVDAAPTVATPDAMIASAPPVTSPLPPDAMPVFLTNPNGTEATTGTIVITGNGGDTNVVTGKVMIFTARITPTATPDDPQETNDPVPVAVNVPTGGTLSIEGTQGKVTIVKSGTNGDTTLTADKLQLSPGSNVTYQLVPVTINPATTATGTIILKDGVVVKTITTTAEMGTTSAPEKPATP